MIETNSIERAFQPVRDVIYSELREYTRASGAIEPLSETEEERQIELLNADQLCTKRFIIESTRNSTLSITRITSICTLSDEIYDTLNFRPCRNH